MQRFINRKDVLKWLICLNFLFIYIFQGNAVSISAEPNFSGYISLSSVLTFGSETTYSIEDGSGSFKAYAYIIFKDSNKDGKYNSQSNPFQITDKSFYNVKISSVGNIFQYWSQCFSVNNGSGQDVDLQSGFNGHSYNIKSAIDKISDNDNVAIFVLPYTVKITYYKTDSNGYPTRTEFSFSYNTDDIVRNSWKLDSTGPVLSSYNIEDQYTNTGSLTFTLPTSSSIYGVHYYVIEQLIDESWENLSANITGTGAAVPSATVTLKKNNDSYSECEYNIKITGYDYLDNASEPCLCTIIYDVSPPTWSNTSIQLINTNTLSSIDITSFVNVSDTIYYNYPGRLEAFATDNNGIAGYYWTINGTIDNQNTSNICEIPSNEGVYNIQCSPFDKAGNLNPKTVSLCIDKTSPIISKPRISFEKTGTSQTINSVNVQWDAGTDSVSGLASYEVLYKIDSNEIFQSGGIFLNSNTSFYSESFVLPSSMLQSRTKLHTVEVKVQAIDKAGNIGNPSSNTSLMLPPLLTGTIIGSNITDAYMNVSIELNVSKTLLINSYASVQLFRMDVPEHTELSLNDEERLLTIPIDPNSDIQNISVITDDQGVEHAVITDSISVNSGAGHKYIQYMIYGRPLSCSYYEEGSLTNEARLPNNPGTVTWELLDMDGNAKGSPYFKIYTDGKAQIAFTGKDIDAESWCIELDRIKKVYADPEIISSVRISGKAQTLYSAPNDDSGEKIIIPVTLAYGNNNLKFAWEEGESVDGEYDVNELALKTISLSNPSYGVYSVSILDGYATYDSTGITVRPGEPLGISIESDIDSENVYKWDFSDGSTAEGQEIEHAYKQKDDRTGDTSTYSLGITITESGGNTVGFNIHVYVKDTQEGELYCNEIWRGDHTVVGNVIVPSTMTLSIGESSDSQDMIVTFSGGAGGGYEQGFTIQNGGALNIFGDSGAVVLKKAEGQESGWGTIYVEKGGKANLNGGTIQDAERGLSALSGSAITITECSFLNNEIGLHLFGGSAVSVTDTLFSGNSEYGIKEEQSAVVTCSGNIFSGNTRNFYSWEEGPISIDELNGYNGNDGNKEE